MTTAAAPTLAVPSLDGKVKMEDRKRSLAPDADDAAPRPKRQRDENMRMSTENEAAVEVCHPHASLLPCAAARTQQD